MKYGGAAVTVGRVWRLVRPIGAVQVAGGGHDVAWKNTATGRGTQCGAPTATATLSPNVIGAGVSGTSTAVEALETIFNQDLNGDGTIGIPSVVIQTDGSTSLKIVQVGGAIISSMRSVDLVQVPESGIRAARL